MPTLDGVSYDIGESDLDIISSFVSASLGADLLAGSAPRSLRRIPPSQRLPPPVTRPCARAVDRSKLAAAGVDSGDEADDELEPVTDDDVESDEEETFAERSGSRNGRGTEPRPGHAVNTSARKEVRACGMSFTAATARRRYQRSVWTASTLRDHRRAGVPSVSRTALSRAWAARV